MELRVTIPDPGDLGPAMRELNERQRAFVYMMTEHGGDLVASALAAGYGEDSKSPEVAKATAQMAAHRMMRSPKVLAAIREEGARRLDGGYLIGVAKLIEIAVNAPSDTGRPPYKDATQLRAIERLLGPEEKRVKHEHRHTVEDERELRQGIEAFCKELGIDPGRFLGRHSNVVDAEFTALPAPAGSTEGLEDLL